jgi:hypothetical protein
MADNTTLPDDSGPARIDIRSADALAQWSKKLDVTEQQLKDAVAAVGDLAPDVEMHLKGSRATTNDDQIAKAANS